MTDCGSWNPVSIGPTTPYYPNINLPSVAQLELMGPDERNKWREKAKHKWLAIWQKTWRDPCVTTSEQEDQLVALYRTGREAIFGSARYGCGFSGYKKWEYKVDMEASRKASLPAWYTGA